ncbi:MAG: hypothetical protein KKF12_08875 [Proteobacteria bacterium]|nr:hypothetical protein [Desulfobacula sp.]MBU3952197.1 hypothetical protein [Pseudomonadota bacterium]MBU4130919.1 hypothetical protein [Pseudomonadota bacterium]
MKKSRRLIPLVAALIIGLGIHASFAWAEGNSPTKVVEDFAKAYFMLDPAMATYLSHDAKTNENDVDMVELYLRLQALDAYNRGYQTSYLQMHPILMKTRVLSMDDSSATIQFDAIAIRNINPLYRIVGYVFGLLEEHSFQDTLVVVNEDGEWKVGPGALGLPF